MAKVELRNRTLFLESDLKEKKMSGWVRAIISHRLWAGLLLVGIAGGLAYFYRLDAHSIILWDEARLANNAIEMVRTGDLLVTYYGGAIDFWNVKPPLLIWLMAGLLHIVQSYELAIRLLSALAGFATTILVFLFGHSIVRSTQAGLWAAVVLMLTNGFNGYHGARTGDYDAFLVLWTTAYCLSFFLYLEAETAIGTRRRWLAVFAAAVTLATMTKGIAGMMMLPSLALYTIWRGKLLAVLSRPSIYIAAAFCMSVPAAFYLLRESLTPGYLAAVVNIEVIGRYMSTLESHYHSPFFYVATMVKYCFPWTLFLPISILVIWRYADAVTRRIGVFLGILIITYVMIISFSGTKLPWYIMPIYPFVAILIGISARLALPTVWLHLGMADDPRREFLLNAGVIILVVALVTPVFLYLGAVIHRRNTDPPYDPQQLEYGEFINALVRVRPDLTRFHILHPGHPNSAGMKDYFAPAQFYATALNLRGYQVTISNPDGVLAPGEVIVFCGPKNQMRIERGHQIEPLLQIKHCMAARATVLHRD